MPAIGCTPTVATLLGNESIARVTKGHTFSPRTPLLSPPPPPPTTVIDYWSNVLDDAAIAQRRLASTFAFVVMPPRRFEIALLRAMHRLHVLHCLGTVVAYTNVTGFAQGRHWRLSRLQVTRAIEGSMEEDGNRYGCWPNREVFVQVWTQVLHVEQRHRTHDWILKFELDTLLLPHRLWPLLVRRPPPRSTPMLLAKANHQCAPFQRACGIHGALEVISHAAAKMFASELPTFLKMWDQVMNSMSGSLSSSMQSSEDPMLELWVRAAGVHVVVEPDLLNEQVQFLSQCSLHEPTAAYHPLRTAMSLRRCWLGANGSIAQSLRPKASLNTLLSAIEH